MLLRKSRSYGEIYNDLDGEVVNLFRVLRDPVDGPRLCELLSLTPFARAEFNGAYEPTDDPVESARRLIVRSFMGFGSDGTNTELRTSFRANSNRSGTLPAHDWANYAPALHSAIERLRGVIIENRDAAAVMAQHDNPTALHYVDPPYVHATRSQKARRASTSGPVHAYKHELTDQDHVGLCEFLKTLTGFVILSGYPNEIYRALKGWRIVSKQAHADGARPRTECLWINPPAADALSGVLPLGEAA